MDNKNEMERKNYYDEYEIDLREYIMLIWNHKWFIAALFAAAVIMTFFYSFFLTDPVYEAKSTLLILPPRYTTSLEVDTFSLDTYRNLATTDSIMQNIIDKLDLKNKKEKKLTISNLENMIDIEIHSSENEEYERKLDTPLIELKVRSKNSQIAAKIANRWAEEFIEVSREIRSSEVKEVSTVIQEQFSETEKKLNKIKEELLVFKKENRLNLLEKRLSNKENKLTKVNKNIVNLESGLGLELRKLETLNRQISNMEENDSWAEELSGEFSVNNNLNAADKYLQKKKELLEFKSNNNIFILEGKITSEKKKYNNYFQKLSDLEIKYDNQYIEKIISLKEKIIEKEADKLSLQKKLSEMQKNNLFAGDLSKSPNIEKNNLAARSNYLKAQNRLLEFKKKNDLQLLNDRLNIKRDLINSYNKKIDNLNDRLNNAQYENKHIKTILNSEKPKLTLRKSINENAFWNNILEKREIEALTKIGLNNEILNPIYNTLKKKLKNNNIIIESYPEQIKYFEDNMIQQKQELKELKIRINKLTQEKNNLEKDLNQYKANYDNFVSVYLKLKSKLRETKIEISNIKNRIEQYENFKIDNYDKLLTRYNTLIKEQKNEIMSLEAQLFNWRDKIKYLENDIANYKKIYEDKENKYRELLSNKLDLELNIEKIRTELNYYKNNEEKLIDEIKKLQNILWEGKNKSEKLNQRIADVQNTYNALAKRVEEARITEAQRTSDVKFFAEAVEPTEPLQNNIKLNLAIAGVLALMLGVFIVFFKKFMKEE